MEKEKNQGHPGERMKKAYLEEIGNALHNESIQHMVTLDKRWETAVKWANQFDWGAGSGETPETKAKEPPCSPSLSELIKGAFDRSKRETEEIDLLTGNLLGFTIGLTPIDIGQNFSFSYPGTCKEESPLKEKMASLTFGEAITALRDGLKVSRAGWNGKRRWLELQVPDDFSKMTLPYIYINYPVGAPGLPFGARCPWLASQTDMLTDDWMLVADRG